MYLRIDWNNEVKTKKNVDEFFLKFCPYYAIGPLNRQTNFPLPPLPQFNAGVDV
jgi:hypothetical protein